MNAILRRKVERVLELDARKREIKGYDHKYYVSERGCVYDCNMAPLKMYLFDGYLKVALKRDGVIKCFFVHRLVAITFISNPLGKETVDHINGVRDDNRVENLRWCSQRENCSYDNRVVCATNTSEYPGVDFNKQKNKFRARIYIKGKRYLLGHFASDKEANDCRISKLKLWEAESILPDVSPKN